MSRNVSSERRAAVLDVGRKGATLTKTEKWWAMSCSECGGFVPIRIVEASERVPPALEGSANCVRCRAPNVLAQAALFVIDGTRLRRIKISAPADYVK